MQCIEHEGYFDKDGYGQVYYPPHKRQEPAHRVSYAASKGIPLANIAGVIIRHSCDNRKCINPEHLEPGTQKDNMQDMIRRGRLGNRLGVNNNQATVSDLDVTLAIRMYEAGAQLTAIGRHFGVSRTTVRRWVKGECRAVSHSG